MLHSTKDVTTNLKPFELTLTNKNKENNGLVFLFGYISYFWTFRLDAVYLAVELFYLLQFKPLNHTQAAKGAHQPRFEEALCQI